MTRRTEMLLLPLLALCALLQAASANVLSYSHLGDLTNPDNQNIQLDERHRMAEYKKRNHTWPIQRFEPDTPGWTQLMKDRFEQVVAMPQDRYEGFMQTVYPAFLAPNFTEHGFGLARCPLELLSALQDGIIQGLPTATLENRIAVIDGPNQPLFVNRPDLTRRVLSELQHYAETWVGLPLTAYRAYGFRLYRNESALYMHVDKPQTHIVSFILHIGSSDDAEPWPIYIEVSKDVYMCCIVW
jgi:hypothetical protein